MKKLIVTLMVAVSGLASGICAQEETRVQRDARMAWWREARFGLFVHWGLYSGLAGTWDGKPVATRGGMEWIQQRVKVDTETYAKAAVPRFKPSAGFAREWARLAKAAGCRYIVFTTKHHEGFALHDSKVGDYDAGSVLQRDLVKEIVEAARAEGLRVGFYHSVIDWHHDQYAYGKSQQLPHPLKGRPYPNGERDHNKYLAYLHQQVDELVSNYPVDILWWDYSAQDFQGDEAWNAFDLMRKVRAKRPGIIMNNRLFRNPDAGWASMATEGYLPRLDPKYGDFITPEQHIPATGMPGVDWETCMTMNTTWGYSEHDHAWKSDETLIRNLIDIASKGGNYLLNIGPQGDGSVPEESTKALQAIGSWMKVYGEAIYATTASPFTKLDWGRCTQKRLPDGNTRLYLHVFDWPKDGRLFVPGLKGKPLKSALLRNGMALSLSASANGFVITLPAEAPDPIASVVVLDMQGMPQVIETGSETPSAKPTPMVATPQETPEQREARLGWWRAARFGLFVHWGPVSLKGTEIGWSRAGERRGYRGPGTLVPVEVYDNLYKEFNPTLFNAREWVAIAKAAGMKYLVFTSRHHDGFSMFDTQAGDYRITHPQSPFRRDVVKELADACHEAGFPFGLYYSQPDWRHPDAFTTDRHERYLDYLRKQVRELASNYGRLDILWFDGLGKPATDYDGVGLVRILRGLQPHIIINNRTGLPEDHDTPEQTIGRYQDSRPWESCITIGRQWAWKPDDSIKSIQECLHTLVRCAGGDGNLLFNVGPMPDGRIEPRQVERLKEMGAWLAEYGESVYSTRGGPWKPAKGIASTRRGNTVFVHVLRWSGDTLSLPNLPRKVTAATLLTGGKVETRQSGDTLTLAIPVADRRGIDTVIKLELDGSAMDLAPLALTPAVKATASNVYRQREEYGAEMAFDDDPDTRWATDNEIRQAWVAWEFDRPRTIAGIRMDEAVARRVKQFEFQVLQESTWRTIFTGASIGPKYSRFFDAVLAKAIRLNILEASEAPTISEIQPVEPP